MTRFPWRPRVAPVGRALVVALVASLSLAGAFVTDAAASTPEEEREAFALYQSTREDFDARNYQAALEKLERAYALFPKPLIHIKMAEALEALGRIEEAHAIYSEVDPKKSQLDAKVATALRRLEGLLAKPVPVFVATTPDGARVFVDGEDTGKETPALLELPRGQHLIFVERKGYRPAEVAAFDARGIDALRLDLTLSIATGQVTATVLGGTLQDTQLRVRDTLVTPQDASPSQSVPMSVPAGTHRWTCHHDGVLVSSGDVTVTADASVEIRCVVPEAAAGGAAVGGWVTFGLGLAAAGVGAGFLAQHFLLQGEVDGHNDGSAPLSDPAYAGQRLGISDTGLIVGAAVGGVGVVAAITGLVLALSDDGGTDTSGDVHQAGGVRFGGSTLPGGGLFTAAGRF